MKRHTRRDKNRYSFALSALHPLARATIVLLALVQVIAPTWHICALGGNVPGSAHQKPAEEQAKKQAEIWKPKCGGGPQCPCVPPAGAIVSPTGQFLSAAHTECDHGTCLAQLLMGMPGSLSAPFDFVSFAERSTFAPSLFIPPCVAAMPQPPARGPPLSSV